MQALTLQPFVMPGLEGLQSLVSRHVVSASVKTSARGSPIDARLSGVSEEALSCAPGFHVLLFSHFGAVHCSPFKC